MNAKRLFLLLIGDKGAFLLPPAHLKDAHPVFAANNDQGETSAIMHELNLAPRVPVLILYDGQAQLYKTETLPSLAFWDRTKILMRRLQSAFEQAEMKGFLQRKNKTATLVAIQENAALTAWFERLKTRPALSGFVSLLPMESASLAAQLEPTAAKGWAFCLTQQKTGRTRFIATRDGQLVFTRLTSTPPSSASAGLIASTIALEVKALRDYLARFGLVPDEPLTLVAVMPSATHESLAVTPMDVTTRLFFTPHQAAVKLGLPFAPPEQDPYSDLVHLLALAQKRRPSLVLMTPKTRMLYKAALIRRMGLITTGLVLALLFVMISIDAALLIKSQRAVSAARQSVQRLETSFRDSQASAATGDDAQTLATLRKAVERRRLFQNEPPDVVALLEEVAPLLQGRAKATALDWQPNRLILEIKLLKPEGEEKNATLTSLERDQNSLQIDALLRALQDGLPDYAVTVTGSARAPSPNAPLSSQNQNEGAKATATFMIERKAP